MWAFLVGPCACIVKAENPGTDILMTVDRDAGLQGQKPAIPEAVPPITGLADFTADRSDRTLNEGRPSGTRMCNVPPAVAAGVVILAVAALVPRRKEGVGQG